jgi:hypothetical protein
VATSTVTESSTFLTLAQSATRHIGLGRSHPPYGTQTSGRSQQGRETTKVWTAIQLLKGCPRIACCSRRISILKNTTKISYLSKAMAQKNDFSGNFGSQGGSILLGNTIDTRGGPIHFSSMYSTITKRTGLRSCIRLTLSAQT